MEIEEKLAVLSEVVEAGIDRRGRVGKEFVAGLAISTVVSRVYWHTKERTAELHGSERAWLAHIAQGPATAAWDLGRTDSLERAAAILALAPEPPAGDHGANYLHAWLREAQAQHIRNLAAYEGWKPGQPLNQATNHELERRLVSALETKLRLDGLDIVVAGVPLQTSNLDMNTALDAGSDPICLAAKIHGWCEIHCWFEGPDRVWAAEIIEEALDTGIYRRGFWYVDRACDGLPADQPDRKWSAQGWDEVLDLLRERDDGPVVLSYSVCDEFPNPQAAGLTLLPGPDGVPMTWEAYEAMPEGQRRTRDEAVEQAEARWNQLSADEQWDMAMDGLRRHQPWAQISPDTLATVTFGPSVNVYELFAPDRDDRVRAAVQAVQP